MPYPTQHENFYKNRIFQLQQKLQQLTEIYNYRLNEAGDLSRVIRRIPDPNVPGGGIGGFIPNGPDGNPRGYGRNNPTIDPADLAAREAAAAAAAAAAMAARLAEIANWSPARILNEINPQWSSAEFREYVRVNYGTIIQTGSSYYRLFPDGTVHYWGSNDSWININKPGFNTPFGKINNNGVAVPPQPTPLINSPLINVYPGGRYNTSTNQWVNGSIGRPPPPSTPGSGDL